MKDKGLHKRVWEMVKWKGCRDGKGNDRDNRDIK